MASFYLAALDQVGRVFVERTTEDVWTATYLTDVPDTPSVEGSSTATAPSDSTKDLTAEFQTRTQISDEEFESLFGPTALVPGTARRFAWTELPNGTTLGLLTSRDVSAVDKEAMFCLWDYASVGGAGGSAVCAPSAAAFAQLLEFGISGSSSCAEPALHMASVWGLPPSADIVTFELSNGTVLETHAANGIAQVLWDYDASVSRILFDGATPEQVTYMEDFLGANQATCAEMNASTGGG